MTKIENNYVLVKEPTIDWAEWERDSVISFLTDIRKNILSALIILMYQNDQGFGKLFKIDNEKIRSLSFASYVRDTDITRSLNHLIKKNIVVWINSTDGQYLTVPRFFRRVA